MFKVFATWRSRRQAIRELSSLSDRELADIGVIRGEIESMVRQGPDMHRSNAEASAPGRSARVGSDAPLGYGRSFEGLPSRA